MRIQYLDQIEDLSNVDSKGREECLNRVFAILFENNHIVQEVVIDGLVFRENYESVLLQRMEDIKEIRLITLQGEVVVEEILVELSDYVPRVIKATESISDLFYGEMSTEDWGYFSQLLEGIGWVESSLRIVLDQLSRTPGTNTFEEPLTVFSQRLPLVIQQLEDSLSVNDRVAVGDIIKYELGELMEGLDGSLQSRVNV